MRYSWQSHSSGTTSGYKRSTKPVARTSSTTNSYRVNKPTSSANHSKTKVNTSKPRSASSKNDDFEKSNPLPKGYAWVEDVEKRSSIFRKKASLEFLKIKERAMTQTMYVLDRKRTGSYDEPEETIEIAGSTGNVYTVRINRAPCCDCPHARKGNHCKHIVYILVKTLKAPEHLQYQRGLLTSELNEIFESAPPIPTQLGNTEDSNRKPVDPEDDCPICCEEFGKNMDKITYCATSCGNNIHKNCFQQWAKSCAGSIKCPFCRSNWAANDQPDLKHIADLPGEMSMEGNYLYRNLGRELNLTGPTDFSTYHMFHPWR